MKIRVWHWTEADQEFHQYEFRVSFLNWLRIHLSCIPAILFGGCPADYMGQENEDLCSGWAPKERYRLIKMGPPPK